MNDHTEVNAQTEGAARELTLDEKRAEVARLIKAIGGVTATDEQRVTLAAGNAMANVGERFARLAVMAATGCDEATAIARLDDATDRMLNATADAAQLSFADAAANIEKRIDDEAARLRGVIAAGES